MPHPSKLKLPEWLNSEAEWENVVGFCDNPIKFALLAADLLTNKVFESTDHFWIVLYLLSEDIQEAHSSLVICELHHYRELAFQKPYYLQIKEKKVVSERLLSLYEKVVVEGGKSKACEENPQSEKTEDSASSEEDSDIGTCSLCDLDSDDSDDGIIFSESTEEKFQTCDIKTGKKNPQKLKNTEKNSFASEVQYHRVSSSDPSEEEQYSDWLWDNCVTP
jgi:hypothetical protein